MTVSDARSAEAVKARLEETHRICHPEQDLGRRHREKNTNVDEWTTWRREEQGKPRHLAAKVLAQTGVRMGFVLSDLSASGVAFEGGGCCCFRCTCFFVALFLLQHLW